MCVGVCVRFNMKASIYGMMTLMLLSIHSNDNIPTFFSFFFSASHRSEFSASAQKYTSEIFRRLLALNRNNRIRSLLC